MYIWVHFKTGQRRSVMGVTDDMETDRESDNESEADTVSQPPLSRMMSREAKMSEKMDNMGAPPGEMPIAMKLLNTTT